MSKDNPYMDPSLNESISYVNIKIHTVLQKFSQTWFNIRMVVTHSQVQQGV